MACREGQVLQQRNREGAVVGAVGAGVQRLHAGGSCARERNPFRVYGQRSLQAFDSKQYIDPSRARTVDGATGLAVPP